MSNAHTATHKHICTHIRYIYLSIVMCLGVFYISQHYVIYLFFLLRYMYTEICCFRIKRGIKKSSTTKKRRRRRYTKTCQLYQKIWSLTFKTMWFNPHLLCFITSIFFCLDFYLYFFLLLLFCLLIVLQVALQVNNRVNYGNLGCKTVNIKLNSCCKIVWLKKIYTHIE